MCDMYICYTCEICGKEYGEETKFTRLYKLEYAKDRSSTNIHKLFGKFLCPDCLLKEEDAK